MGRGMYDGIEGRMVMESMRRSEAKSESGV
jgi:hypothetical protein